MSWLLQRVIDYVRLGLFVGLVLVGVQVPGFIQQYQSTVSAHWAEARQNLAPYQEDARIFTDGDLDALIKRYLKNSDKAIVAGGRNLSVLVERVAYLADLKQRLSAQNSVQNLWLMVSKPDRQLLEEAQAAYQYQVQLNPTALIWGLAAALCGLLFVDLVISWLWSNRSRSLRW